MTPSSLLMGGFFVVGVSSVAPCCGVVGFVLGVVVTVGYRPTGSSKEEKRHHPRHQETQGKGGIKT